MSASLPMARALIADDEPILRLHLVNLLAELWPQLEVVALANHGIQALDMALAHQPDIVFLDIKMPGLTGLEVAAELQKSQVKPFQLVFLTAYDQYAVDAFDCQAIDYLLKPVEPKRLERTLDRLQASLSATPARPLPDLSTLQSLLQSPPYLRWINALKGDDIHVIACEQVLLFKAEDKYTTLVTPDGEYLIRRSLKQLEQELDPELFWRVHRNSLVQVAKIRRVRRDFTGQLKLHLEGYSKELPISRRLAERFKQM